jgi:hypothetical protein
MRTWLCDAQPMELTDGELRTHVERLNGAPQAGAPLPTGRSMTAAHSENAKAGVGAESMSR